MFFNLAWRNSKRSRNENLIYFLTMVTAVAAFYIVLSLGAYKPFTYCLCLCIIICIFPCSICK